MWTSERSRRLPVREAEAELGLVTLSGDPAGVVLGGERRQVPVYSPGGYFWRPREGERVLVLKTGGEGESPCVVGKVPEQTDLRPGEVCVKGGGSTVLLGERCLDLSGEVTINGVPLEEYILSVASALLTPEIGG